MKVSEIIELIHSIGEGRNQELKGSMNWNTEETKFKVTKAILAMSNIRSGGVLIFGAEESSYGKYQPVGVSLDDYESFDSDNLADHVGKYTRPYAKFHLEKVDNGNMRFVTILVEEFDEFPVLCGKPYFISGRCELREGDICTRTRNTKPQSSKVTSYLDMKDILDLAIEKGVRLFVQRSTLDTGFGFKNGESATACLTDVGNGLPASQSCHAATLDFNGGTDFYLTVP